MTDEQADYGIYALRALIDSVEKGPDEALAELRGRTDPESLRRHLAILLREERFHEAAELARANAPHGEWCDKGVAALVLDGDVKTARRLSDWAAKESDGLLRRRCALAYADASLGAFCGTRRKTGQVHLTKPTPEEKEVLEDILEALDAIVLIAKANGVAETALESLALLIAIRCQYFLGRRDQCDVLARLLVGRKPVPLGLAELAMGQIVSAEGELPERLRKEHPESFHAQWMAAYIEGRIQGKHQAAFDAACDLVESAQTLEDRKRLWGLLNELSAKLAVEASKRTDELGPQLLADEPGLLRLWEAEKALKQGDPVRAKPILDECQDESDSMWLQLRAFYLDQTGDAKGALDSLVKANKLTPVPELSSMAAAMAFRIGELDTCADMLNVYLDLRPDDASARRNLAGVYTQERDFARAAEEFGKLRELEPDDPWHGYNQAVGLSRAGQSSKALQLYDSLCDSSNPMLALFLARAQLLKSMGRSGDALKSLAEIEAAFWDEPGYVMAVNQTAFAAGDESKGHDALVQLNKLRAEGKVPPEMFRPVSMDEVLELTEEAKKHRDAICAEILHGKVPWLLADSHINRSSYWAWTLRTQPLRWLSDELEVRAEYSIYATNSYSVVQSREGAGRLARIECSKKGSKIVADLSALITLHRLGLLDKAASYFGSILVPAACQSCAFDDSERLIPHQPSEQDAMQLIVQALDDHRIAVLGNVGRPGNRPMPFVNEHTFPEYDEEHFYRLSDLLEPLHTNGMIDDKEYREARRCGTNASGVDKDHPFLALHSKVLVAESTLKTVAKGSIFDTLLEAFQVHMLPEGEDDVRTELSAYRRQGEVKDWHLELWDAIGKSDRFIVTPYRMLDAPVGQLKEARLEPALAAMTLSRQLGLPLVADDRFCQAVVLNEKGTDPSAAFGTDCLMLALWRADVLTLEEATSALLQLVEWRYRFIVLPGEILKALSDHFAEHPPGRELRCVAEYVHECMRDPGLLGGFERTDPPSIVGNRLFQDWSEAITEFIIAVWEDADYSEDKAIAITEWAVKELLPSPPKCMKEKAWVIGEMSHKVVLGRAMIHCAIMNDRAKANKVLRAIAKALGVSGEGLLRAATEMVDGI